jgi:hypothetical protein
MTWLSDIERRAAHFVFDEIKAGLAAIEAERHSF